MLSPLRYGCGPLVRAWNRHDIDVTLSLPAETIPTSSPQQSPFDIPVPQRLSGLLTRHLELQLNSCKSRLESRKQLLLASIKALAHLEAGSSNRWETHEERLARHFDKRDCVGWIAKHRHAIEKLQRHILQLEKEIKYLNGVLTY